MELRLATCEDVIGKKMTQHKEWISSNTIKRLIEKDGEESYTKHKLNKSS
jgi:hypothetical protein